MHKLFLCPVAKLTQYIPFIFKYIHPCIRAKSEFDEKKINYEIEWVPFRRKLRKSVFDLSNQLAVPIWRDCNGKVIIDSHVIISEINKVGSKVLEQENTSFQK